MFRSLRAPLFASASGMAIAVLASPSIVMAQDNQEAATSEDPNVIVVEGRRAAIESAIDAERDADQLVSIVTSDDVGQFGDPTVAESLQRIPGVSINRSGGEGQQVSIRGLPTEFATVTLDGARLGSTDPDVNSTSLDFFSADNLSRIEVVKTLLPEMEADAIAGTVNLRTISALDRGRNSFGGRAEVAYGEKAEAWNPEFAAEFTRIIDAGDNRIGIAAAANWSRRETITDSQEVGDGLNFFLLNDDDGDLEYIQGGDADNCQDGDVVLECYLIPVEADLRSEELDRERFSISGQLEFEMVNHLFQVRGSYARVDESSYTNRATFDFSRSDGDVAEGLGTDDPDVDEIVSFGLEDDGEIFGVFEDGRAERRLRPGDQTQEVWTIGLEGTSTFGDVWTANYGANFSRNNEDEQRIEGRFRSDNITMSFANLGANGVDIDLSREQFDFDDDDLDPTVGAGFPIRTENIGGESFGTPNETFTRSRDSFNTYYLNLEREFTMFGRESAIKVGGRYRERTREYDFTRIEYLVDPDVTLADFPNSPSADRSNLNIPIDIERGDVEATLRQLIENGRVATVADRGVFITIQDLQDDFIANEDVLAGYVQWTFNPFDRFQVIAGVRVEDTDYSTSGSAVRQLEYDDGITDALQAALENGGVADAAIDQFLAGREPRSVIEDRSGGNSYTDFFPSVNIRWEPTDTTQVRASFTTGIKRPEYREAAAIQFLSTSEQLDDDLFCGFVIQNFGGTGSLDECPADPSSFGGVLTSVAQAQAALSGARAEDLADTGQLAFETEADPARNPFLDPLTSMNWDVSFGWYPNDNTALSAAVFHKRIENFIVPISLAGQDVTRLGFDVDDGTESGLGISRITTFANGDSATITGLELSYYQAYTFLPGILGGLFTQANVTFAESSASSELVDRDFRFPDQSDVIGNLSVGWENEVFSIRGAVAYQGDRLRGVNLGGLDDGNDTAGDVLEDSRTQVDINVRYELLDGVQLYFDAQNITDAGDRRFFRGSDQTLNGRIFSALEDYGPTYQFGVRARF